MKRLITKSAAFIITAAMAGGIILPAGIITSPVSVNADVTRDGALDLTDLATLKQFISKKISGF